METPKLTKLLPEKVRYSLRRRGLKGSFHHFLRRAGAKAGKALTGPDVVRINPMGVICNHTCPMCWLQQLKPQELQDLRKKDKQEGLTLEEYIAFFDGLPDGVAEINVVGGGEPLAHKHAIEIMAEIKKRGWSGSLISNGTLLGPEKAEALVDMRWDSFRCSIHAGDPATYEAIQGVPRYEKMRENLIHFNEYRHKVGAVEECSFVAFHVIQPENFGSIDKLFQIAHEIGADFIEFDPIIPYSEDKKMSPEEYRIARETLERCAAASAIPCNSEVILPQLHHEEECHRDDQDFVPAKWCSVGFVQTFVTSFGEVTPCCFSNEVMGNVREQSFTDIWKNEKYRDFRKRLRNGQFAKYCIENRCTLAGVLHND